MPKTQILIPQLTGGVSRQPNTIRNASQVQEATNIIMPVWRGAERRPGTLAVFGKDTLGVDTSDKSLDYDNTDAQVDYRDRLFVHWVDRDPNDQYLVVIDDQAAGASDVNVVQMFRLDGTKVTFSLLVADATYLKIGTDTARDKLRAASSADTTIITNNNAEVFQDDVAVVEDADFKGGFGYTDGKNFLDILSHAGVFNSGELFYNSVSTPGFPSGVYEHLSEEPPVYERITAGGVASGLLTSSMPIRLAITDTDNDGIADQFETLPIDWSDRLSGDQFTNPGPSFGNIDILLPGTPISDVAFWSGRLWFGAGITVVSSQSEDFFNYYINDPTNFTSADPIDITLTEGESVGQVSHFVPFSKSLITFTKGGDQHEIRFETFSSAPTDLSRTVTTRYPASAQVRPITLNNQMFFPVDRGDSSAFYEYFYSFDQANNTAIDVSDHVEDYVPANLDVLSAAANAQLVFMKSPDEPNALFLYQSYWSGEKKVQSAWMKWEFDEDTDIVSYRVFGDFIYLLLARDDKLWLEKASVTPAPPDDEDGVLMPYSVRMDRRYFQGGGVFDDITNETTWTIPYGNDPGIDTMVLGAEWTDLVSGDVAGKAIAVTNNGDGTITAAANWTEDDRPVWFGRSFESTLELSKPQVRDESGRALQGEIKINELFVRNRDSGFFNVRVTPSSGREPKDHVFPSQQINDDETILGQLNISSENEFKVPRVNSAVDTKVEILSDNPLPFTITGLVMYVDYKSGNDITR